MTITSKGDVKKPMNWGYAGVYPGDFRIWDGDEFTNRLNFLAAHGFRSTGLGLKAIQDPVRFKQLTDFVIQHDFHHTAHFGCRYFEDSLETIYAGVADFLRELARVKEPLGITLVTTSCGPYHRFMRTPSLDFQLERLQQVLTPLAKGCEDLGLPLGIENHCDYFISDLVKLCQAVPNLGIFFDTGNAFMTGETPAVVSRLAAPYVVGTHFKDYTCFPDEKELKLVVTGAAFGEGDVDLKKIYEDLVELNPAPEKLAMEFEMIPDPKLSGWENLERSKRFVESISGFKFKYPNGGQS